MELKEIVPEYHSKNLLVRKLFWKRLQIALQLAESKLRSGEDLSVVDLGCGEGILLKLIEERFKNNRTFGIDIEPNTVKLKKFLKAEIKIADLMKSGFPNGFFDIAFCLDVLEHFKNLEQPIKEIKRITKPGGLLIVSLPTENLFYKGGEIFNKGNYFRKKGSLLQPPFSQS